MSIKPPAPRCQYRNHLSISLHLLALDEALRTVRRTGYGGQNALSWTEQPVGKHMAALAASACLYWPPSQVLPPVRPSSSLSVPGALPTFPSPLQRGKGGWDSPTSGQFSWSSERTGNGPVCSSLTCPPSSLRNGQPATSPRIESLPFQDADGSASHPSRRPRDQTPDTCDLSPARDRGG